MKIWTALLLVCCPTMALADVVIGGGVAKPGVFPAAEADALIASLVRSGPITCTRVRLDRKEEGRIVTYEVDVWRLAANFSDDFPLRDGDVVSVPEHVIGCVDPAVLLQVLQRYLVEKKKGGSAPDDWAAFAERAHGACSRQGE